MTADFKNSQNFHLKRTEKIKSLMWNAASSEI
jgi:hypothetical protein